MRIWVAALLGGLAMAPIGGLVVLMVSYAVLALRGVTEQQGRRGMAAFLYALIIGGPLGFWVGFKLAWWLGTGGGGTRSAIALGAMLCVLGVLGAGLPALVAGVHLAERRGVSHSGGQRTVWAVRRMGLPAAIVGGIAAFALGWWLGPH